MSVSSPTPPPENEALIVQRAAAYIRARGNNFGRRMLDVPDMPGYVRFVDREGRPLEEGELA